MSKPASDASQRNDPRYRGRVPVRFGVSEEANRLAFTSDVSPTGIHVLTGSPVQPGQSVKLELTFPDGQVLSTTGVVRWAKRSPMHMARRVHAGFGVEFTSVPEAWYSYYFSLDAKTGS